MNKYETASILNKGMTVHGEPVKDVLAAIDLNEAYDYMMDLASRKQPLNQSIIRDLNRLSIAKTHPDWANENRDRLHPVQYAADLHLKFVSIHPFRDGNGRTARLLMNLALTEAGYPVINVFPDEKSRNEYMDVLATSRREKKSQPFEDLIGKYAEKTLLKRIKILQLNEHNIAQAKKETNLPKHDH